MPLRFCTFYQVLSLLFLFGCHAKQGQFYEIRKGDTAHRIAHAHGISVNNIQKANPQKDLHLIIAGQKLWIPSTRDSGNQQVQQKIAQQPVKPTTKPSPAKQTAAQPARVLAKNSLRFEWPYPGKVISSFGKKDLKMHNGIDIEIPSDAIIKASQSGKVAYVGDEIEGYGKTIIIQHDELLFSVYAYLGQSLVKKGDTIANKQNIARPMNQKGQSFFHFEIRKVKTALDPLTFLSPSTTVQ